MPYTHLIFDLDGTLLDTLGDLAGAVNHALTSLHLPTRTRTEVRTFVGNGVAKLIERALPAGHEHLHEACLSAFYAYYAQHQNDNTQPYDGIVPLLSALREKGCTLGVLSNKYDEATRALVAHFFPNTFSLVCGAKEGVPRKPDPTAVHTMLGTWGVSPARVLYLGDSGVDMQTAKHANLFAVGVTWGFRTEEELIQNGADAILHHPTDLLQKEGLL